MSYRENCGQIAGESRGLRETASVAVRLRNADESEQVDEGRRRTDGGKEPVPRKMRQIARRQLERAGFTWYH
jgi:hypothetical protein